MKPPSEVTLSGSAAGGGEPDADGDGTALGRADGAALGTVWPQAPKMIAIALKATTRMGRLNIGASERRGIAARSARDGGSAVPVPATAS